MTSLRSGVGTVTAAPVGLTDRQKIVLALILTAQFMAVLDATIVTVAIPTIRRDLGATGADLQLIIAGYVTAYAAWPRWATSTRCSHLPGRSDHGTHRPLGD
ncbi:MAG TPA: hypothetical protein VE640_00250 [Candidatus Bathyarchaeia archaeon]|nr:hypothetical protein [Candidatus Bathyarchaeia archaeon]